MPVLSSRVDHAGRPIVAIYVIMGTSHAQDRRGQGLPTPGALLVNALVDTGAGQSHVDLSILEQLELSPVGEEVDLYTASTDEGPRTLNQYAVDLSFAGDQPGPLAEDLRVIGSLSLAGLKVQMLLGRDVLDGCLLAYDGPNRRFSLAYDAPAARPGN